MQDENQQTDVVRILWRIVNWQQCSGWWCKLQEKLFWGPLQSLGRGCRGGWRPPSRTLLHRPFWSEEPDSLNSALAYFDQIGPFLGWPSSIIALFTFSFKEEWICWFYFTPGTSGTKIDHISIFKFRCTIETLVDSLSIVVLIINNHDIDHI